MAPAGMPATTRLVLHQDQLSWLRQLLMRRCLPDKSCVLMRIDLNTVYGSTSPPEFNPPCVAGPLANHELRCSGPCAAGPDGTA